MHHRSGTQFEQMGPPKNVVQKEMRLLTNALQSAVLQIGMGNVTGVADELHRVHEAKEATEAAIRGGSYKPPKNADNLPRFQELDAAFHQQLEGLVKASKNNETAAAAQALSQVLQGCESCHTEFR